MVVRTWVKVAGLTASVVSALVVGPRAASADDLCKTCPPGMDQAPPFGGIFHPNPTPSGIVQAPPFGGIFHPDPSPSGIVQAPPFSGLFPNPTPTGIS